MDSYYHSSRRCVSIYDRLVWRALQHHVIAEGCGQERLLQSRLLLGIRAPPHGRVGTVAKRLADEASAAALAVVRPAGVPIASVSGSSTFQVRTDGSKWLWVAAVVCEGHTSHVQFTDCLNLGEVAIHWAAGSIVASI